MARRADPARIFQARRAAIRNTLTGSGMLLETAERWLDAWVLEATGRGLPRDGTRAIRAVTARSRNDGMTDREAAWDAVYEALPAGWTVGPPTYDPGVPGWSVTARSVAYSRRAYFTAWTSWVASSMVAAGE